MAEMRELEPDAIGPWAIAVAEVVEGGRAVVTGARHWQEDDDA